MGMAETQNFGIRIVVTRAAIPPFHRCVRAELHKTERSGRSRISMAVSSGSDEEIDGITRHGHRRAIHRQE